MCERIEINSEQDWQDFLDSATREELEILKEDILSGKAFSDDDNDEVLEFYKNVLNLQENIKRIEESKAK